MLDGITCSVDMSLGKLWELVNRESWRAAVHGGADIWTQRLNSSKKQHRAEGLPQGAGDRRGEGEIYGKSNMETCITICKIT